MGFGEGAGDSGTSAVFFCGGGLYRRGKGARWVEGEKRGRGERRKLMC